ncbi:hypothetical protein C7H73_01390 [Pulveribacter suum]|uniref:Uncharacterized protein n=2 Tax=Pulveribacter suum TaxID=2116657 RepID=A0A2P1NHD7_9BURK|nr:hypothetical protein C7H73_01390 [Pulveribacter suum]
MAALLALGLATAACSNEAEPPQVVAASGSAAAQAGGSSVREAIQDQMLPAIEKTYASRKAQVSLQGSVVHVRMDGDASAPNAGWTDCRAISQLIRKEQTAVLEFPNGTIDCPALFKAME